MAFAVHKNMFHCTGCNNCVVACPGDAPELHAASGLDNRVCMVRSRDFSAPDFRGRFWTAGAGVSGRAHTVLSELPAIGNLARWCVCNKKQREG